MKAEIKDGYIVVTKELHDPVFRNVGWGANGNQGESRLLYHLKKILNSMGYDLIKKRMVKDGHLTDEYKQYLRTRNPSGDPKKDICIYNHMYCIQGAEVDFNRNGQVTLKLLTDIFDIHHVE